MPFQLLLAWTVLRALIQWLHAYLCMSANHTGDTRTSSSISFLAFVFDTREAKHDQLRTKTLRLQKSRIFIVSKRYEQWCSCMRKVLHGYRRHGWCVTTLSHPSHSSCNLTTTALHILHSSPTSPNANLELGSIQVLHEVTKVAVDKVNHQRLKHHLALGEVGVACTMRNNVSRETFSGTDKAFTPARQPSCFRRYANQVNANVVIYGPFRMTIPCFQLQGRSFHMP